MVVLLQKSHVSVVRIVPVANQIAKDIGGSDKNICNVIR